MEGVVGTLVGVAGIGVGVLVGCTGVGVAVGGTGVRVAVGGTGAGVGSSVPHATKNSKTNVKIAIFDNNLKRILDSVITLGPRFPPNQQLDLVIRKKKT
jgi:hypothetical protein